MKLHPFHLLSGAIAAVLAPPVSSAAPQVIPSPCSYPRITTITVPSGYSSFGSVQPTPIPDLRRHELKKQMSDSLGWNNLSTCNVGVCPTDTDCTLFAGDGLRDRFVTGACSVSGAICLPRTVGVANANYTLTFSTAYRVVSGTAHCGTEFPHCYSRYIQYGYGLGTFLQLDCAPKTIITTTSNPSWALYTTESNPPKGLMPVTRPPKVPTPTTIPPIHSSSK